MAAEKEQREAFGGRVREARKALDLTGTAVAEAVNKKIGASLGRQEINAIEKGRNEPRAIRAAALAEVLGVSVEWLAFGDAIAPASYHRWLQSPAGELARGDRNAQRFMVNCRVPFEPPEHFWGSLHMAYINGLKGHEEMRMQSGP